MENTRYKILLIEDDKLDQTGLGLHIALPKYSEQIHADAMELVENVQESQE